MIVISAKANAANPSLASWLEGAGLAGAAAPAGGTARILDFSERAAARPADLVLHAADGPPSLAPRDGDRPALLRFGAADRAFGTALAAELVRPQSRPSCGEPISARLLDLAERVAATDVTILLLGETGTGKEGLARFIHAASPRADEAFVAVNCAALPETMLEAILFGHKKGSFTGAGSEGEGLFRAADKGTLLLDEIAEMALPLQSKLLRALQEREILPVGAVKAEKVDVRIIACANRDLAREVAAGRFRADLYWRLNVMPLALPPLGERRLDILAIAAALLVRHAAPGAGFPWPTAGALDRLIGHDWPGNVRELDNVIQRAILLRRGDRIERSDLLIDDQAAAAPEPGAGPILLNQAARSAEAEIIRATLAAVGGHRIRAAERLGISERTLRYRLADMRVAVAA